MAAETHQARAERRKESKAIYEEVIRVVDYQSGHIQPPLASKPSVLGILSRGRYGLDKISRAIVAARSNGDLFVVTDPTGRQRIGINDREILREKIAQHLSRTDDPRKDVIGLANDRIQKLREADSNE
ncbi:hypothetical protein HALLA_11990 [Halostagnicola larsenii XH-48]|uniref:Uncharacterized protein n=1 Tax=Halostagnicola larsenii XH-48 TaxID=797299 RepID=W0JUI2_9EURY|nr:hypothetical protein [Halostagnicola larsenii]AHG00900.1 hypothetical protein HALLA_11700 [Halostagnicola larsenii XH-48]AHG00947.1 hypothetical protein HALLA_11990 [Halostagnicola larsenii XH-48]